MFHVHDRLQTNRFETASQTYQDTRLERVSHASAFFSRAHTHERLIHTPQAVRQSDLLFSQTLFFRSFLNT